ncbi:MAG: dipeptide ABC transporter ATP-binding protein [Desulfobacterales bacterium]|nr:MAG: dipeptide ABC transporter ATP-binding protein [Desulfobacterales bacterium]
MKELLRVENLKRYFAIRGGILLRTKGYVYAVDDVTFSLNEGETLGLVGESGCGKSTVARTILRLIEPTAGKIYFNSEDITEITLKEMRALRKDMQLIFQDPYASLNPRMKVGQIIGDPMDIHKVAQGDEKRDRIAYLLKSVGLKPDQQDRYPREFSGGQRQRIGIARALASQPKVIIGDEPVSALDVSIQAQIINLLEDLQAKFDLSYIMISHDLTVIEHICDRIAVMYLGRIVETAAYDILYNRPQHPYTEALLSAVTVPDPDYDKKRIILKGDVPSPINPPTGCHFHTRCMYKQDICEKQEPRLKYVDENQWVACHLR